MMTVLLESAGVHGPKRTGWTLASVSLHAALLTGAIVLTTRASAIIDEPVPIIPIVPYVPAEPPEPAPSQPGPEPLPGAPAIPSLPTLPMALPNIPTFDVGEPFAPNAGAGDLFRQPSAPIASGNPVATGGVYTTASVQRIARPLSGHGSPEYPRSLRSAGVEGSVVVTFVVDTTGRAEPGSVRIVSTTHPLFADAVRRWLTRTRYAPAEIDGQRVRQLVQQDVGFALK